MWKPKQSPRIGHDTTSALICYAAYLLAKNPACLARIRQEHDEILGPVSQTPERIKQDANILNKLDYTHAVIRETLRLYPSASTIRTGTPGFKARDPATGEPLETEDMWVWVSKHRRAKSESAACGVRLRAC